MKTLGSAAFILALGVAATPVLAQSATSDQPMSGQTRPSGKDGVASGTMGNMTKTAPKPTNGAGMTSGMNADGTSAAPTQQN